MGDDDIDRITHRNAMRHFMYDPFSALGGRENCTVGALPAKAAGHGVPIRGTGAATGGRVSKTADFSAHRAGVAPR